MPPNLPHIMIVSDKTNAAGQALVIHNIGAGAREEDRLFEFMLNVVRLMDGFDEALFTSRTGLAAETLRRRIQPSVEKGLIAVEDGNIWRVTSLGRRFLNDLQADFLPE